MHLFAKWFPKLGSSGDVITFDDFDEQWYTSFYKDVGIAVARGDFSSGLQHYLEFGRNEQRLRSPRYRVAVWSTAPEERAEQCGWYWMAQPLVREYINTRISGRPDCDAYGHLAELLADRHWSLPIGEAVSLGCGFGALERDLAKRGIVRHMAAFDLSEAAIAQARSLAQQHGLRNLSYQVADLEVLTLPAGSVDAVFAHQSIHHVNGLERLFSEVSKALRPHGIFHLHEFVGPTRFQWTDQQISLVNEVISSLPTRLRSLPSGEPKPLLQRPTVEAMIAADPTEAIRSAEISPLLARHFRIIEHREIGGALLHLALGEIAQNFDIDSPEDRDHLQKICQLEQRMMKEGVIGNDFAVITAARE